jgi:hypothetical protein
MKERFSRGIRIRSIRAARSKHYEFKPADLSGFHRQLMETSRLLLVIVGDVDAAEMQKQVAAAFGILRAARIKMPRLRRSRLQNRCRCRIKDL